MSPIDYGFILFSAVALIEGAELISNQIFRYRRIFKKLGFNNYTLVSSVKEKEYTKLKIRVLVGGSIDDFKKHISQLEKAFAAQCSIEDEKKSKYINVYLYN